MKEINKKEILGLYLMMLCIINFINQLIYFRFTNIFTLFTIFIYLFINEHILTESNVYNSYNCLIYQQ